MGRIVSSAFVSLEDQRAVDLKAIGEPRRAGEGAPIGAVMTGLGRKPPLFMQERRIRRSALPRRGLTCTRFALEDSRSPAVRPRLAMCPARRH